MIPFLGPLYLPWSDIMACLDRCSLSLSNAFTVLFCFFILVVFTNLCRNSHHFQLEIQSIQQNFPPFRPLSYLYTVQPSSALKPELRYLSWCSCCCLKYTSVSYLPSNICSIFLNSAQILLSAESFFRCQMFSISINFFSFRVLSLCALYHGSSCHTMPHYHLGI